MWRVLEGDCRTVLAGLEPGSVHTCVTSPPFFGLRDYGHAEQIGLEPSPDEFVAALVDVFREVRRVLRDDGTVWLNLGDSYSGSGPSGASYESETTKRRREQGAQDGAFRVSPTLRDRGLTYAEKKPVPAAGTKPKDLIGIPWMVAFALRADGWYLRSDIIWSKPNPMPESVTDRPTKSHEYVFLLSKGPRYFYDADAIREAHDGPLHAPGNQAADEWEGIRGAHKSKGMSGHLAEPERTWGNPAGRNKRSVWTVATQPYPGAHFATFPSKLIEPCILAGCPERACRECGAPWTRVVERTPMVVRPTAKREAWQAEDDHARTQTGGTMLEPPSSRTVGWEPSCAHDAPTIPGTVLDPFTGAGTTGVVALRHDRSFVGIELNPEYVELARRRIVDDAPLLNSVLERGVPAARSHRRVLSCLPHPRSCTRRCCGRSRRERYRRRCGRCRRRRTRLITR
jgi:DNA modification methylase